MPYRALLLTFVLLTACNATFDVRTSPPTRPATVAAAGVTPALGFTSSPPPAPASTGTPTLLAVTAATSVPPTPTADDNAALSADALLFPETAHTLSGSFRTFWQQNGGLPIFGLPLTEPLPVAGRTMQYFERTRFELNADGSVSLGLLGSEEAGQTGKAVAQPDCRFFVETGHNVCAPLLDYWQGHGGLPIFGLPLAEAEQRGATHVQRFERARIEQDAAQTILLGRIGDEALHRLGVDALLRPAGARPATAAATITAAAQPLAPLDEARLRLELRGYDGPAELTIGDHRGSTWQQSVVFHNGAATVTVAALGALGAHAAVLSVAGKIAAVEPAVFSGAAQSSITTGQPRFDRMLPLVKGFMDHDISEYTFGTNTVHGYRSPDSNLLWLRDHVHQAEGYAYWEPDMRSLLDQFRRFQHADGAFDDYMANFPWAEIHDRTQVEADNEYLFIEGVFRAWQATGDDAWLRQQVDAMERGLAYIRTSPQRWDSQHQLVKRPFTVDTWDFEYGPPTTSPDGKRAPRHWIDQDTKWSIFHGDNTGYAHSMDLLAQLCEHLGNHERAAYWHGEARGLMDRLVALAWNGSFFRHMVHLVPVTVPGVDEASQLSLSNTYALNRDVLSQGQARTIIEEYQRRYRARGSTFAEWFSIDPPFPAGSLSTADGWGRQTGEYVNGGIMPLVGGELARGALAHGYERYGLDILQRYYSLIDGTGGSYLWYHPIGQPGLSGPDSLSTDGWGSSAMLAGLIEGVAGVRDQASLFETATLAPRWSATDDVHDANVTVRYGASDGYVHYHWSRDPHSLQLTWTGSGDHVRLHLLLPDDAPARVSFVVNGQPVASTITQLGGSRYLDSDAGGSGSAGVRW